MGKPLSLTRLSDALLLTEPGPLPDTHKAASQSLAARPARVSLFDLIDLIKQQVLANESAGRAITLVRYEQPQTSLFSSSATFKYVQLLKRQLLKDPAFSDLVVSLRGEDPFVVEIVRVPSLSLVVAQLRLIQESSSEEQERVLAGQALLVLEGGESPRRDQSRSINDRLMRIYGQIGRLQQCVDQQPDLEQLLQE